VCLLGWSGSCAVRVSKSGICLPRFRYRVQLGAGEGWSQHPVLCAGSVYADTNAGTQKRPPAKRGEDHTGAQGGAKREDETAPTPQDPTKAGRPSLCAANIRGAKESLAPFAVGARRKAGVLYGGSERPADACYATALL
jgi:hypothetical protein